MQVKTKSVEVAAEDTYSTRLKQVRQALGVSRNQFVDIAKVSLSTINRIELENTKPTNHFFNVLARNLPAAVPFLKFETGTVPTKEQLSKGLERTYVFGLGEGGV